MNLLTENGERVRNNYRLQGAQAERERIIVEIERQICFDAQADADGRCVHHGGKCYELRQLITRLESK